MSALGHKRSLRTILAECPLSEAKRTSKGKDGPLTIEFAKLLGQHGFNTLHDIEPVDQVVDVIELVGLEHEYIAHFVGRYPVFVQTIEAFQIRERHVLFHFPAAQLDTLSQSAHRTAQVNQQVGWPNRVQNRGVEPLIGVPIAFRDLAHLVECRRKYLRILKNSPIERHNPVLTVEYLVQAKLVAQEIELRLEEPSFNSSGDRPSASSVLIFPSVHFPRQAVHNPL